MAIEIKLRCGNIAIMDEVDIPLFERWTWRSWRSISSSGTLYLVRSSMADRFMFHREILNALNGICIDHKNRNGLDNRRDNLRTATLQQNNFNRVYLRKSNSGFRGVTRHSCGKWQAGVKLRGRSFHLGLYDDPAIAAAAYDKKAVELFGDFAVLNFPSTAEELSA